MLDPANGLLPIPSSPTISSVSSSDLDTESTGSFFHDRSTTLGTLMGVNFPAISAPTHPDQSRVTAALTGGAAVNVSGGGRRSNKVRKKTKKTATALVVVSAVERRRRWWKLCSWDDAVEPASLGDFLEVERRYGDGAFYGGGTAADFEVHPQRNGVGRLLFEDGRVLPPTTQVDETTTSTTVAAFICRFPLTGICRGGG